MAGGGPLQGGLLMIKLILFFLAVYGLANAIAVLKTRLVVQAIFGRIPILKDLIKCPPCLSFWIGMAFSYFCFSPSFEFMKNAGAAVVVDGLAASGFTWIIHVTAERIAFGLTDI